LFKFSSNMWNFIFISIFISFLAIFPVSKAQNCNVVNNNECKIENFIITKEKTSFSYQTITKNVTKLTFNRENCAILFIPTNINASLPNLQEIIMNSVALLEITSNDMSQFTKLTKIGLDSNRLEKLPRNLFKFNPMLKIISLKNNKIKTIHPTAFDGVMNIKRIYLQGNKCVNKSMANPEEMKAFLGEIREQKYSKTINNSFDWSLALNVIQFAFIIVVSFYLVHKKFKSLSSSRDYDKLPIIPLEMHYASPVDVNAEMIWDDNVYADPVNAVRRF
jgi:hypothetical protein